MEDVARARSLRLERRIAELLAHGAGVGARVQLTLPEATELPLDAPLPHPRAVIVMPEAARGASDSDLTDVVRSTLADDRAEVVVLRQRRQAPPTRRLVSIGPFRVDEGSAGALRSTLAVMFITNALLALLVLAQARRHRPKAPKVDRRGRSGG